MKQPLWNLCLSFMTGISVISCGSGSFTSGESPSSLPVENITEPTSSAAKINSLDGYRNLTPTTGISVVGIGNISVTPDAAVISIGVESRKKSVKEAKLEASKSMNRMIEVLIKSGISKNEIMTKNFRISPQYSWVERLEADGTRYNEQILKGYVVTNEASVRTKKIDSLGVLVDDLVESGGKPARIKGIQFTVIDPKPYQKMARELAMEDAIEKANQYAFAADVSLGDPAYISETNSTPLLPQTSRAEFGMAATESMPILTGELEISTQIHVVFEFR